MKTTAQVFIGVFLALLVFSGLILLFNAYLENQERARKAQEWNDKWDGINKMLEEETEKLRKNNSK